MLPAGWVAEMVLSRFLPPILFDYGVCRSRWSRSILILNASSPSPVHDTCVIGEFPAFAPASYPKSGSDQLQEVLYD